jgi:hypothetical protein
MVCFCDIPLSEVKNHIKIYGHYGIGLRKEWAVQSRLNPIIYMEKTSFLSASLIKFTTDDLTATGDPGSIAKRAFCDIFRYMKYYEGDLVRKNRKTIKSYRFSDEREWRYVPEYTKPFAMVLNKNMESYETHEKRAKEMIKQEILAFEPEDIQYIIIRDDSEIPEFLELIRDSKGMKYHQDDIDKLTTRLLTAEQIKKDI